MVLFIFFGKRVGVIGGYFRISFIRVLLFLWVGRVDIVKMLVFFKFV